MGTLSPDVKVAVLVDCDNVPPDILDYAARVAAQFGRVVLRRGYGNIHTLSHRWQDALVRMAFTPCLQYQFASGKNTADIALALDALEAHFDLRANTFCVVTSDSDFAFLSRKLRERGSTVCVVGEEKTPEALRNASDQFFEWTPETTAAATVEVGTRTSDAVRDDASKPASVNPPVKRRPGFLIEAVKLLAGNTDEGKVVVSKLGDYLKRADPAFSPRTYGHSGLMSMIRTYDLLASQQEEGGHWTVRRAGKLSRSAD